MPKIIYTSTTQGVSGRRGGEAKTRKKRRLNPRKRKEGDKRTKKERKRKRKREEGRGVSDLLSDDMLVFVFPSYNLLLKTAG